MRQLALIGVSGILAACQECWAGGMELLSCSWGAPGQGRATLASSWGILEEIPRWCILAPSRQ